MWRGREKKEKKEGKTKSLNIWARVERESEEVGGRNEGWREEGKLGDGADGETNRIWMRTRS